MNRKHVVQHQLRIWLSAPKFANRVDNHCMPGQRRGNSDSKRTGSAKGDPLGATHRLIDILQDASRVVQEQFPRCAQSNSSRQSVEQRESQFALQIPDLPRQGGLSNTEALSRTSKMLLFANDDEVPQVPKFHLIPSKH
jgi:hypothetical protein